MDSMFPVFNHEFVIEYRKHSKRCKRISTIEVYGASKNAYEIDCFFGGSIVKGKKFYPLSDFGLISTLGTSIYVNVPNDKIVTLKRNYL
jgi:hypothetical protein